MDKKYLNFNKISETETELYIYGNIEKKTWIDRWLDLGEEKTDAYTLKDALQIVDTPNLTVRINSRGGSVDEGLAIYSLLSEFKGKLKTIVDGFACSAASVIFMAGEERVVPENGVLMIHNAWSSVTGDSNAMKKMSEDLEKITQPSVDIYVMKTGLSEEKVKSMMDKSEWITSKEAFELGFSTTQTRKTEAMQSVESDFVYNLVMENKKLKNELEKSTKDFEQKDNYIAILHNSERVLSTEENNMLNGTVKETPKGLAINFEAKTNNNQIKEDAWTSFFNTKNNQEKR